MPVVVHRGSDRTPRQSPGPVLTIGNFDGVHRGHQALLARVIGQARAHGTRSCAYTFDPSPVEVLRPELRRPRIQSLEDRLEALGSYGIDEVIVEAFDLDFARHDAAWFASEVIGRRIGAQAVVVGWDFRFGHGREGDATALAGLLPIPVEQVPALSMDGEVVSSSRIRNLLLEGDVDGAARLLGRPYRIRGRVVHGDGRGRTIGFPTANIDATTELLPANGVYAVWLTSTDGRRAAVANLGTRPTFDGVGRRLEAHALDGASDLYGQDVAVDCVARLRGEVKFSSKDELVAQIARDCADARLRLS